MNIFGLIMNKFKNFCFISIIIFPCFVEAIPFYTTEMQPEIVNSNPLVFRMVSQDIYQMIEVSIIFYNGFVSWSKSIIKFFASFGFKIISGAMLVIDDFPNCDKNEARSSDNSSDDWCIQFIFYLSIFGSVAYMLFLLRII